MVRKIKHPRMEISHNLVKESIQKHLTKTIGIKTKVELSNGIVRVGFNRPLGESVSNNDFVKDELKKLLFSEYGLVPVISRHKDAYNIILNPDQAYLENANELRNTSADPNIVLDSRFIWLFSLMTKDHEVVIEDIDSLDDSIELAIENNDIKIIVANPYIDPDPKNNSVDLVFADNPGPVIIYDGTKASDLVDDEEVVEESTQPDAVNHKVSYGLGDKEKEILSNKLFKDWWIARDKDNELFLFKDKPVRSSLNLESTGELVRWLPELDASYDYRDFNEHKEYFEFLTWDEEPIQVKCLLEEDLLENKPGRTNVRYQKGPTGTNKPESEAKNRLASIPEDQRVFKAIEYLITYAGYGQSTQITLDFKDTMVEIMEYGNEFISKVNDGFEKILSEIQKREAKSGGSENTIQLKQQIIKATKQFKYIVTIVSDKSVGDEEEISLTSLAQSAGILGDS